MSSCSVTRRSLLVCCSHNWSLVYHLPTLIHTASDLVCTCTEVGVADDSDSELDDAALGAGGAAGIPGTRRARPAAPPQLADPLAWYVRLGLCLQCSIMYRSLVLTCYRCVLLLRHPQNAGAKQNGTGSASLSSTMPPVTYYAPVRVSCVTALPHAVSSA